MARYGPADAAVSYGAQALADVTVISDLDVEAILEEITAFGQSWEQHAYVGVKRSPEITLEAPYTDDSNLLRDKADDTGLGGTATLLLTFGGSKTYSVSTIQKRQRRKFTRGALTMFSVTLQPTGTVTEA